MRTTSLPEVGPDWIASAPIGFDVVRTVPAPADVVFDAFADTASWVEWFPGLKEAHDLEDGTGLGARRVLALEGLTVTEVITRFERGTRWSHCVVEARPPGIARLAEDVLLDADGHGATRVTWRAGVAMHWWALALGPVVRRQMRSSLAAGLDGLAAHMSAA